MSRSLSVRRTVLSTVVAATTLLAGAAAADAATQPNASARPRAPPALPGAPGVRLGPEGSAFYDAPARLPAGKPGTLIWARPIQAPKGAWAWKVLYKSKVVSGRTVPVSGIVISPRGKAPKGGRPVVAWAHGTLGGARDCAPSLGENPAQNLVDYYSYGSREDIDVGVPALTQMLKAGYTVTATDYQGLGTAGVHQYTVGMTEAYNVFDSVKAAQHLPATAAGNRVVLLGWSQGGGAAVFAGQAAVSSYRKPLQVLGIAALAPAANTAPDIEGRVAPGPTSTMAPSVLTVQQLNAFRGFAAAYPELSVSDVVAGPGMPALRALGLQCTIHLGDVIQELGVDVRTFFKYPLPSDWRARFEQNTAGNQTSVAPILTMQGTADTVVNPNGTTQYIERACRFGQPVQYSVYQGASHQTIPFVAQQQYVNWIADRFAGKPAPSNCSS